MLSRLQKMSFMNEFIKYISADRVLLFGTTSALIVLFITLMYIAVFYPSLPPVLPIFNQLPWGIERLGGKIQIFLPTLLVLGIIVINVIVSKFIYERMPLTTRMLHVTTSLLAFLTLYFTVRIIQLII